MVLTVAIQSVPAFHLAAGNPARVIRKIETAMDSSNETEKVPASAAVAQGPEVAMAKEVPQ